MIDIVALAESYTRGKTGKTQMMAREAFIAGAQALSVALRAEMQSCVDYAKPSIPRRRKRLKEGHQWFTA